MKRTEVQSQMTNKLHDIACIDSMACSCWNRAGYPLLSKQALPFPFPAMALTLACLQDNVVLFTNLTETNLASLLPVYQVTVGQL